MRILLLAGLALSVFASQAVWVTLSPVASLVAVELGVSKEMVGLLALVYPVLFLILTVPSGLLLDKSFKAGVGLGSLLTAAGAGVRLVEPGSYEVLLAGQVLAGVGQPLLLNSFAPAASRLYPGRRELVVSLLSFSMYLGIIYALGMGYRLYTEGGLVVLLAPPAAVALAGLALTMAGLTSRLEPYRGSLSGLSRAARSREVWLLGIVLGLGVALFDNMSIWLEPVLSGAGLGDRAGGALALSMVLGLVGVSFIPGLVVRAGVRTLYIRIVSGAAVLVFLTLSLALGGRSVGLLIPLLGLLMLPAYPVIMEWVSRFYPGEVHGSASGLIGLSSRVLTVALASVAVLFIDSPRSYFLFLALLSACALGVSLLLPRR